MRARTMQSKNIWFVNVAVQLAASARAGLQALLQFYFEASCQAAAPQWVSRYRLTPRSKTLFSEILVESFQRYQRCVRHTNMSRVWICNFKATVKYLNKLMHFWHKISFLTSSTLSNYNWSCLQTCVTPLHQYSGSPLVRYFIYSPFFFLRHC